VLIGFIWLRLGPVAGPNEDFSEHPVFMKGDFLEWLSDCQVLRKYFAPWSELVN
jgi:hypothetical protein